MQMKTSKRTGSLKNEAKQFEKREALAREGFPPLRPCHLYPDIPELQAQEQGEPLSTTR